MATDIEAMDALDHGTVTEIPEAIRGFLGQFVSADGTMSIPASAVVEAVVA